MLTLGLFFAVLLLVVSVDANSINVPSWELQALSDLYDSTNGTFWRWFPPTVMPGVPWNFAADANPCADNWQGIECSDPVPVGGVEYRFVVALDLMFHKLSGSLPPSIGNLTQLVYLHLGTNALHGSLPDTIGALTHLTYLNISQCPWTGTLPASIGNLAALQTLDISIVVLDKSRLVNILQVDGSNNQVLPFGMTGTLPSTLAGLQELKYFSVAFNRFSGSAAVLGTLAKLETLCLSMNRFFEPIPTEWLAWRNLRDFSIGANAFWNVTGAFEVLRHNTHLTSFIIDLCLFTGTIPDYVGGRTNLTIFELSYNRMNGTLPDSLRNLTKLQLFDLANNSFSGPFPSYVVSMPALTWFNLDNNSFTGTLPDGITDLPTLQFLTMQNNRISGTLPAALNRLTEMAHFNVGGNRMHGAIPAGLSTWAQAYLLDLGGNRFTGTIPLAFGQLGNLSFLNLSGNLLYGVFPESLCGLTKLTSLDLSANRLFGTIPATIGDLQLLTALYLQGNRLSGSLPATLSALTQLQALQVHRNSLSGPLHGVFNSTRQLRLSLVQLSDNQFTGQFPEEIFTLPALQTLAALVNCFHGTLPGTVCQAASLRTLAMDGLQSSCQKEILPGISNSYYTENSMHGGIPGCVYALPQLQSLHLSGNGFRGIIPENVTLGPSLTSLAISNNNLWGTIPAALQHRAWVLFDLSFNYFSGVLLHDFGRLNASATLALQTNRLSGEVPDAIRQAPNVNILNGNLFACGLSKRQLPNGDPNKQQYVCGSNAFDAAYYLWLTTAALVAAAVIVLRRRWEVLPGLDMAGLAMRLRHYYDFPMNPTAITSAFKSGKLEGSAGSTNGVEDDTHGTEPTANSGAGAAERWDRAISVESHGAVGTTASAFLSLESRLGNFKYICQLTSILCHVTLYCALASCILLLYYPNIAAEYRTHRHTYAYQASAAYVNGVVPFVTEFVLFMTFLIFVLVCVHYALHRFQQTEGALLPRTHDMFTMGQRQVHHLTQHKLFLYGTYFVVNFVVVLGVNVLFVYISLYQGSRVVIAAQVLMSLFKLLWNNLLTLYAALHFVEKDDDGIDVAQASLSRVFYMQLVVLLLNNIAIPCLVVAAISPNCFYNVFIPPPAVQSSYQTQKCDGIVLQNGCNIIDQGTTTISYNPPFSYSYQCSSSFVKNYAPSFVYMCFAATFVVPLVQELTVRYHRTLPPGSTLWLQLNAILQYPELSAAGVDDVNRVSLASTFRQRMYFNANQLMLNQLTFIGIMLTFGVVFPPLAVALALTVSLVILYSRLKVGQFLIHCVQLHQTAYLDKINGECTRVVSLPMLRRSLWILVSFACCFYALFLFDALGDVEGFGRAYWVLIVLPLMPIVLCTLFRLGEVALCGQSVNTKADAVTGRAECADGAAEEPGIVMNPFVTSVPEDGPEQA